MKVIKLHESIDDMDKRCEKCNTLLNDSGTCPKCDDGEEDYGDLKESWTKTPNEMMDAIDNAQFLLGNTDLLDEFNSILNSCGANDDDSDPDLGYFAGMSDEQILNAYNQVKELVKRIIKNMSPMEINNRFFGTSESGRDILDSFGLILTHRGKLLEESKKEPFVNFYHQGKKLGGYTAKDEFDGEREDTIGLLAHDNKCDPSEIEVKVELTEATDVRVWTNRLLDMVQEFGVTGWAHDLISDLLYYMSEDEVHDFALSNDYLDGNDYLEEAVLNEGPFGSKLDRAIKKDAKARDKASSEKSVNKVLAKDFDKKKYSTARFILPNGKKMTQAEYLDWYDENIRNAGAEDVDQAIADWHNTIVVSSAGYIIRRGLEDLEGQGVRYKPGETDKIGNKFKNSYTPMKSDETPKDEDSSDETINDDDIPDDYGEKDKDNKKEEEPAPEDKKSEEPAPEADKKLVTDKMLNKFKTIACLAGIKLFVNNKLLAYSKVDDLKKLTTETAEQYMIEVQGKKYKLANWLRRAAKAKILGENFIRSDLKKILTESPAITFNDDEINNPNEINFKKIIADRTEKEKAAKDAADLEAKRAELKDKYAGLIDKVNNDKSEDPFDTLEIFFEPLVPSEGNCDTVAGELVRAMMRIGYRWYNDGDMFYKGYGIETCGSSAEYLYDNGFSGFIAKMMDQYWKYDSDEDNYEADIKKLCDMVIHHILEHPELLGEPNEEDSRDYSNEFITDNQPTYEYEIYASDDVERLVENGIVNAWDLNSYVEDALNYSTAYEGATVERPWSHTSTNVSITNLTWDGLKQIEDDFERNPEGWWESFVDDHADELAELDNEDEEDYDDDYEGEEVDESLKLTEARAVEDSGWKKFVAGRKPLKEETTDLPLIEQINRYTNFESFETAVKRRLPKDSADFLLDKITANNYTTIVEWARGHHFGWDDIDYYVRYYPENVITILERASTEEDISDINEEVDECLTEAIYDYNFGRLDELMEGQINNNTDKAIKELDKKFNRIARAFGMKNYGPIVYYVDTDVMYDPSYFGLEQLGLLGADVKGYLDGDKVVCTEYVDGNLWLYFANEDQANSYLNTYKEEY